MIRRFMSIFGKSTKLRNGQTVYEGDYVSFVNSDGVTCTDKIKKRTKNYEHPITKNTLKQGTLYYWNCEFEIKDYYTAIKINKKSK